jgi:hypothetical protein
MFVEGGRGSMFWAASSENLKGALSATDHGEAVSLCVVRLSLVVLVILAIECDLVRDYAEPGAGRDGGKACFQEPVGVSLDSGQ